jgi:nucleoside-diphosphate-sugar epimerase
MKILVTGSNGFLGQIIIKKFTTLCSITTLGRKKSDIICDLIYNKPILPNFDIIIHAAGKAHLTPINKLEYKTFYEVNVQGTQNLLNGIELSHKLPKSFVFISSVAVYGVYKGENIIETSPLLANDAYGLSKIKAEQLVLDWCQKKNVKCTIFRLPLLIGENPPGNLGTMIDGIKKGFYFNIASGKARKSMVLAEDVADILLKASEIGGIYNITDGEHPNFYELSSAIGKKYAKSRIINLPYFIARFLSLIGDFLGPKFPFDSNKLRKITSDLTFNDTKARKLLGWNPSKVLDYYNK